MKNQYPKTHFSQKKGLLVIFLFMLFAGGWHCKEEGVCTAASECKTNEQCIAQTCRPQGYCTKKGHCLFGQICKNNQCTTNKCSTNKGCEKTLFCQNGLCKARKNVGDLCDEKKLPCQQDQVCITIEDVGKSLCFQNCSTDPNICKSNTNDGRTQCIPFAISSKGGSVSVCLSESKIGESCGYVGTSQKHCLRGQYPPVFCSRLSNNTCLQSALRDIENAPCTIDTSTADDLSFCDETRGLYCDPSTSRCIKTDKRAKQGETCDLTGEYTNKPILCDGISRCFRFNKRGTVQRCALACAPKQKDSCKLIAQTTCYPLYLDGTGVCLKQCKQDQDCSRPGDYCQKNGGLSVCFPGLPPGPKSFGELCAPPEMSAHCKKGLFCLQEPDASKGFCSRSCQTNSDCPSVQNSDGKNIKSLCTTTHSNGAQACVLPCDKQACPAGLRCKTYLSKLCLAP